MILNHQSWVLHPHSSVLNPCVSVNTKSANTAGMLKTIDLLQKLDLWHFYCECHQSHQIRQNLKIRQIHQNHQIDQNYQNHQYSTDQTRITRLT